MEKIRPIDFLTALCCGAVYFLFLIFSVILSIQLRIMVNPLDFKFYLYILLFAFCLGCLVVCSIRLIKKPIYYRLYSIASVLPLCSMMPFIVSDIEVLGGSNWVQGVISLCIMLGAAFVCAFGDIKKLGERKRRALYSIACLGGICFFIHKLVRGILYTHNNFYTITLIFGIVISFAGLVTFMLSSFGRNTPKVEVLDPDDELE